MSRAGCVVGSGAESVEVDIIDVARMQSLI